MKSLREIAYQCLILLTVFGLVFVAFDLSAPASSAFDKIDEHTAVKVFSSFTQVLQNADDESIELSKANINYFKNILLPFVIYLLACGGFIFLILENIRLWKMMNRIKPFNKLMWTFWIFVLSLLSLLPLYLGTSMLIEGLFNIYIVIAILFLFYWTYWTSKN